MTFFTRLVQNLSKYRVQAILVLFVAGFVFLHFSRPSQTNKNINEGSNTNVASEESLAIEETNEVLVNTNQSASNLKTYTSSALGISFNYLGEIDELDGGKTKTKILEQGNKIYIYFDYDYMTDEKPEEGQWVEVFKKEKTDSLEIAIQKQFLAGYSEKDCFAEAASMENFYFEDYAQFPNGYLLAQISFPLSDNQNEAWWTPGEKCPQTYTRSNGISYFLGDENHPDRFLFVSVGQYIIPGLEEERGWEQTIRFVE